MWFGNLVTMQWWDDLWLNEAFAEWMAFKVVNALSPDYNSGTTSRTARLRRWEPTPSKARTRSTALSRRPPKRRDIRRDHLREGLRGDAHAGELPGRRGFPRRPRTYMNEFAESNATGADLWRHLQQASNQPVAQIMESWINQGGYPLVEVSARAGGHEYDRGAVEAKPEALFLQPRCREWR